jgi:photosystem II stability/assembly factor-like uncharacterized protein
MASSDDGWAVGYLSYHYHDGTWNLIGGGELSLRAITMVSPSEGWAVGEQGEISHYSNGEWHGVDFITSSDLNSVTMISANEGWAVGTHGTILHYTNGAWQLVDSPSKA